MMWTHRLLRDRFSKSTGFDAPNVDVLLPLADWRVAVRFVAEALMIIEIGGSRLKAWCSDASKYNNTFTNRAHAQVPW